MTPEELKAWCLEKLPGVLSGHDVSEWTDHLVIYLYNQARKAKAGERVLDCPKAGIQSEVLAAAKLGLRFDRRPSEASLLVRYGAACLEIEYRGWLAFIREGMDVRTMHGDVVYRNDLFKPNFTEEGPCLIHEPDLSGPRTDTDIVASYFIVWGMDGSRYFAWCDREEINKRRKSGGFAWCDREEINKRRKSGGFAWKNWFGPMATKTAVIKLAKSGRVPLGERGGFAVERELASDVESVKPPDKPEPSNALADEIMGTEE